MPDTLDFVLLRFVKKSLFILYLIYCIYQMQRTNTQTAHFGLLIRSLNAKRAADGHTLMTLRAEQRREIDEVNARHNAKISAFVAHITRETHAETTSVQLATTARTAAAILDIGEVLPRLRSIKAPVGSQLSLHIEYLISSCLGVLDGSVAVPVFADTIAPHIDRVLTMCSVPTPCK